MKNVKNVTSIASRTRSGSELGGRYLKLLLRFLKDMCIGKQSGKVDVLATSICVSVGTTVLALKCY